MKVDHLKKWLRRLALLGFNAAKLYTEDTYQLPGEPYFGYCRGAYTADELRQINAFAKRLGIEMIGCIQGLAHLTQVLKWGHAYGEVRDTADILLVGEEKTYALLEKKIKHFADVYDSRRIMLNMDEAIDLGRGRYMDLHGERRRFDIFNEHLARLIEICNKYELRPIVSSDMYFRMGSATMDYYDPDAVMPDDVRRAMPAAMQLVYWDYYHGDEAFYLDYIERHRALGFEPMVFSALWTWVELWHSWALTLRNAVPCIAACKKAKVKELYFCMWGDDGAACEFDSALGGLVYVAEQAYSGAFSETKVAAKVAEICQGDYVGSRLAGEMDIQLKPGDSIDEMVLAMCVLWDDPLLGIYSEEMKLWEGDVWGDAATLYGRLASQLAEHQAGANGAGDLEHALNLAEVLKMKVGLRLRLDAAYGRRDMAALKEIAEAVPSMVALLERLDGSFGRQWLRRNKPFGLEVIQIRNAGLIRRYRELQERLMALVAGEIDGIDELDETPGEPTHMNVVGYRGLASGSSNF
ncbi:MAG: beta-N-acetylhexosaminidase [Planctomycetaceae bacterium]|nr:beta-N-acetylhexosaminidase [Planctomycetaceae bacterium]